MFHADLHIHSRFSRACSRDCDLEHLAWWALRKGITVVGTGDFTHPAWAEELKGSLVPAEPGLLRLTADAERRLRRTLPPRCRGQVRFLLSTEISTIYRRDERTRKVHHLVYAPTFDAADRITEALSKIGNLASDGRPILGLDSRHLLEITLAAGPGCYLVPAHAWTPWFAVLGSKSGFDAVTDCYGDLADHVFAIETGLSSDPPMNWMCSSLDRYSLVSNSDAHSPPMLGREATTFATDLDYFAMADALRTGSGLAGTIEFYPEEGKYHLDGHRKCGVRFAPGQSAEHGGTCPRCGKPLTIGVLHRVSEIADRPPGYRPPGAPAFANLVQLPHVVGEITGAGPKTKRVAAEVTRLVAALGPELAILTEADADDLRRAGGSLLAEAIIRMRRGEARRVAGFDGEYGTVRLLRPGERDSAAAALFGPADHTGNDGAERTQDPGSGQAAGRARIRALAGAAPARRVDQLGGLDPEQQAAADAPSPLMIIAGPGTGKTRTLTHRIARQVSLGAAPRSCLAITFTRRAAEEMRARLAVLVPGGAPAMTVTTFHGLGLTILREHHARAGLAPGFRVADEAARLEVATELAGSLRGGRKLLADAAKTAATRERLAKALGARDLVDFESLVELPAALLAAEPSLAGGLRERWPLISVDEYQDIDEAQYRLLRLLAGDGRGLTAIGDPDQAIYAFRGADVGFFLSFGRDYPGATTLQLARNYRSAPAIVTAAAQAIAPTTLVPDRKPHGGMPAGAHGGMPAGARGGASAASASAALRFHQAPDPGAEASWVAREIDRLLGGSSFHSMDSGRADSHGHDGIGLSDIAVLYRTDAQAGPLARALARAGLPFQKGSHDLLGRRPGVPEIMREMRLAGQRATAPDAPGSPGVNAQRTAVANRLRLAVRTLADREPRTAVDVRTAGEVLRPLALRCGDDMERFVAEIALGAAADALDPRADAITLLTIHAAKGLEFEVVFLAGCERGLLPLRIPGGTAVSPDPAEERRLLFVAMTRARTRLLLSCASRRDSTRAARGQERDTGPSEFLSVIEPGLLARSGPPSARRPAARQLRLL